MADHPVTPTGDDTTPPADAEQLLDELSQLYRLAVSAEVLATALDDGAVELDGTHRSALEMARDNASAIVASLDRVV